MLSVDRDGVMQRKKKFDPWLYECPTRQLNATGCVDGIKGVAGCLNTLEDLAAEWVKNFKVIMKSALTWHSVKTKQTKMNK